MRLKMSISSLLCSRAAASSLRRMCARTEGQRSSSKSSCPTNSYSTAGRRRRSRKAVLRECGQRRAICGPGGGSQWADTSDAKNRRSGASHAGRPVARVRRCSAVRGPSRSRPSASRSTAGSPTTQACCSHHSSCGRGTGLCGRYSASRVQGRSPEGSGAESSSLSLSGSSQRRNRTGVASDSGKNSTRYSRSIAALTKCSSLPSERPSLREGSPGPRGLDTRTGEAVGWPGLARLSLRHCLWLGERANRLVERGASLRPAGEIGLGLGLMAGHREMSLSRSACRGSLGSSGLSSSEELLSSLLLMPSSWPSSRPLSSFRLKRAR
mmetsp:Transcript_17818/g.24450  ORF Transcript_17818/g.24450 Transcript_17818/m.24450 type:complete len:325 (-) Transcript_17818:430-1404(-)